MLPDDGVPGIEEEIGRKQLQERIESALSRFRENIGERELALLDERILSEEPLTLQALGERFGTTREAVRQAEVRLMKKLKVFLKEELGDLGRITIDPGSRSGRGT
jgi:RNA polymerase sigma-32 factor